jgi:hypothetical protein
MKKPQHIALLSLMIAGILTVVSGCTHEAQPSDPVAQHSNAAIKIPPTAQQALHKVLSEGLQANEEDNEDISPFLQNSSDETQYIMSILTNNRCYLGDRHSALRLGILPSLCKDLDKLLQQEPPLQHTLDHAIWMATELELNNLISFLTEMRGSGEGFPPSR